MEEEISGYNIDKRQCEVQEKKDVVVWHAGIYQPIRFPPITTV
jgi:hypothetical protein